MNRKKVITECISFKDYKRIQNSSFDYDVKKISNNVKNNKIKNDFMTLDEIIKFSKDKKNIKSDKKRKELTKNLFIEYLDVKYNNIDDY